MFRLARSLRARLLIGTILWTLGLLLVAHMAAVYLVHRWHGGVPFVLSKQAFDTARAIAVTLSVLCMAGGFFFVRRGLAALEQLRSRLGSVRTGVESRLEGSYPSEVQPLVEDLNALLEHRARMVRRAVAKAGDLAHGLKTPLTVLSQEADRARAAGHAELADVLGDQVERMLRQVDYHLAHARAAAAGQGAGARSALGESVDGLRRTLLRLHASRGIAIETQVAADHAARVEREDLDEMLGNLLDNACKWARQRVTLATLRDQGSPYLVVTIDDDGPGIAPALRETVLGRGVRADEAAPGSGLGLAIVRDLAELYGGSISLGAAPGGGLRASLRLPSA